MLKATSAQPTRQPAISTIILPGYLIGFLVSCAPMRSPAPLTTSRSMETRILYTETDRVVKAAINALQDLHYNIEMVDTDLGIITASQQSEKRQARLAPETSSPVTTDETTSFWKKVLGVTLILALIGGIAWLITRIIRSRDDDDSDKSRERGDSNDDDGWPLFGNRGGRRAQRIFSYHVTLNFQTLGPGQTQLRISGIGEEKKGDVIKRTGPIDDPEFYERFFTSLDLALFVQN